MKGRQAGRRSRKAKAGRVARYRRIIERIFLDNYRQGSREVPFDREQIEKVAQDLGIKLPKNPGDVVYSFRYRAVLPESVRAQAPPGEEWVILPAGRSRYRFVTTSLATIAPALGMAETKVPDSTPGIIAKYALNDEQALLAKLRYNRLIDIFTGVACYSLQNHLRTTVPGMGQVETDEVYVGVDRRGSHYVFPVQAKGRTDVLSVVQIVQDIAMATHKFPDLICRPIAAQFIAADLIALFEFGQGDEGVVVANERHYRLVRPEEVTEADVRSYRLRSL